MERQFCQCGSGELSWEGFRFDQISTVYTAVALPQAEAVL